MSKQAAKKKMRSLLNRVRELQSSEKFGASPLLAKTVEGIEESIMSDFQYWYNKDEVEKKTKRFEEVIHREEVARLHTELTEKLNTESLFKDGEEEEDHTYDTEEGESGDECGSPGSSYGTPEGVDSDEDKTFEI